MLSRSRKRRHHVTFKAQLPDTQGMDALAEYTQSNEQLMQTDATLSSLVQLLASKLFSHGMVFIVNRKWMDVDDDFNFVVRNYWEAFLFRSLVFMLCRGFLAWYESEVSPGVFIPVVPDYSQIIVDQYYEEKTGDSVLDVDWKSDKITTKLRVFHRPLPFHITPESRGSMVDKVKPLLRMLYQLSASRVVAAHRNANTPMVVQRGQMRDPTRSGTMAQAGEEDVWAEFDDRMIAERQVDEAYTERIRDAVADPKYQTFQGKEDEGRGGARAWWVHAEEEMYKRPEARLMYIPSGLQHVNATQVHVDPDYDRIRTSIIEEIYQTFGIPPTVLMSSHGERISAGAEMHNTTFINTMQMWWRVYELLLTDVFRVIHGEADVIPTVAGDNGKRKNQRKNDGDDDDDDGKRGSTARPRKRVRQSDADESIAVPRQLFKDSKDSKGSSSSSSQGGKQGDNGAVEDNVTVFLRSQFVTSSEQVEKLYSQRVINMNVFRRLRLDALGLPEMLQDHTLPEPVELLAQEEILLAGGGAGSTLKPQSLPQLNGGQSAAQAARKPPPATAAKESK